MDASFREFEASSLFCSRCRRATAVHKKLLLVLPTGTKYDYTCSVCGAAVGGKMDDDASEFYRSAPVAPPNPDPRARSTPPDPGRGRRAC